ncbi:MAG: hypothetical protein NUW37_19525 [Planctomycetes bacterium]|nr:hypothetical protein [Planctomycetota bacterium]
MNTKEKIEHLQRNLDSLRLSSAHYNVAHLLGVTPSTVGRWAADRHTPHKSHTIRIDILLNLADKAASGDRNALYALGELAYKNSHSWLRLGYEGYLIASQQDWTLRFPGNPGLSQNQEAG